MIFHMILHFGSKALNSFEMIMMLILKCLKCSNSSHSLFKQVKIPSKEEYK